jgi:hypothetical protein
VILVACNHLMAAQKTWWLGGMLHDKGLLSRPGQGVLVDFVLGRGRGRRLGSHWAP